MGKLDAFDVVIRQRHGRAFAAIPRFYVAASGATVADALAALDAKKRLLEETLDETDVEVMAALTREADANPPAGGIARFAAKVGIVVGCITIAVVIAGGIFVQQAERQLDRLRLAGGGPLWEKIENVLARMADTKSDLTPQRKQRLLAHIRKIGDEWRPFIFEIERAFHEPRGDAHSD